ncbi:MAG: ABC transporter permease [Bacillota bacterium]|nr:ABC transporter permease [Bacillota bacterium]
MRTLRNIAGIAYVEWLAIIRDRFLCLIAFGAVFLYLGLFGLVYYAGLLMHIPVAVWDQDRSPTSRRIVQMIEAGPRMDIVRMAGERAELERLLRTGTVRACFIIPEHLEQDIESGRPARVAVEIDGTNLIYAYNLRRAVTDINRSLGAELMSGSLIAAGVEPARAGRILEAVKFAGESRYNPTYNYCHFLYLVLIVIALQQTCLLAEGLTLAREKERNTWVHFAMSPLSNAEVFAGKVLPYYLIMLGNAGLVLTGAHFFLQLPMHGNIMLLWAAFALFGLAVVGLGYWVSSLCRDTVQATMVICLFNLPMVLGSGFTWPADSMAPGLRYAGWLFPVTWLAHAARAVTMKGCGWDVLARDFVMLAVLAVVFVSLAVAGTRRIRGKGGNLSGG